MNYPWNWSAFLDLSTDGVHTYLQNFAIGTGWTLALACSSVLFALALASVIVLLRLGRMPLGRWLATAYVEVQRNIPLIVHMFLWYFVLPELLPRDLGLAVKRMPQPWDSFVPAFLCLGFYGGARISEVFRAGIESLPRGQFRAATAIGLTERQAFRHVIFPQGIRVVIPALTSEFVSAVKYSSVAFTIGLLELTAQAKSMQEYTFQIFEAFIVAGAIYVVINWTLILVMRALERRLAVPGLLGADVSRTG